MYEAAMGQKHPPDTNTERYLRRAESLREMAKHASSEDIQRELLVVAQQYEKLARDLHRLTRRR